MNTTEKRKQQPIWQDNISQHFVRLRKGKHTTRQAEKRLLLNVVNGIGSLRIKAKRFNQLSKSDLIKLMDYWKNHKNTNNTIYKKLSAIKKHYHLEIIDQVFSYQDVKSEIKSKVSKTYPIIKLSDIKDDKLRFLFKCQTLFGLTFKEALNLKPSLLCEGIVKILRLYAFNGRERHIEISNDQQRKWIDDYYKNYKSVWVNCSHISLIRKHRQTCADLKIPTDHFRYYYLFQLYYELLSQCHCISNRDRLAVFAKLRTELGYCSNAPIKEKIQCLSKCYVTPIIASLN